MIRLTVSSLLVLFTVAVPALGRSQTAAPTGAVAHAPEKSPALVPDPPAQCSSCAEWNAPWDPFKIHGNTYFVGPAGVSSVLVTTPRGHILVDGALQQSAAEIDRHIRALGFKTTDVKLILTSHGHFDHVGGVNALQRYTGATVLASVNTARALELGAPVPEDPQAPRGPEEYFPKVQNIRIVRDGESVSLGDVTVTAHYVPGHTPGATTWTWRSCEGARCLNIVYADSISSISNDGFRFTGDATHPSLVDSFRASIQKVAALPCDILISTHPSVSGLDERVKKRAAMRSVSPNAQTPAQPDPMIDPSACRVLAADAMKALEKRVKTELAATPRPKR